MSELKQVVVFEADECDLNFPEIETAPEWINFLSSKISEIPEIYRNKSKLSISSGLAYGEDPYASIKIYYDRPYTKDEIKEQNIKEAKIIAEFEDGEMRELERLKKKYCQ